MTEGGWAEGALKNATGLAMEINKPNVTQKIADESVECPQVAPSSGYLVLGAPSYCIFPFILKCSRG
jgi:hypothetical protein